MEEGRRRLWRVLVDSWKDESLSSLSEWASVRGSRVLRVLQRRGLSRGGRGGLPCISSQSSLGTYKVDTQVYIFQGGTMSQQR